ncbi:uncharacterized protein [Branchiostoma lanceolatum]|uniref:uncharacterized protein n=1 Tax=Branchiostoma lanceolatum TaxID=7740 RepID=UPI0034553E07
MADFQIEERQTLAVPPLPPKQRGRKLAGVDRHRPREEDLVQLPLNPMYGADLPSGPNRSDCGPFRASDESETTQPKVTASDGPADGGQPADGPVGDQDAAQAQTVSDDPSTHVYANWETCGLQLGQHLSRSVLGAPPVPTTPRPGRTAAGAQTVAAATHVHGDGRTDGAQQTSGGLQPQDLRSQQQPNPMYSASHPSGAAEERLTIWGQLRQCLSPPLLAFVIIASVVMVTLIITLPAVLTHILSPSWHHSLSATNRRGANVTGSTTWHSSVLLRTEDTTSPCVTTPTVSGVLWALLYFASMLP